MPSSLGWFNREWWDKSKIPARAFFETRKDWSASLWIQMDQTVFSQAVQMALAATKWVGREWERERGGRFACVVHSIRSRKNAGKLPYLERLARISCLCFIFGCCHGYWWKEMRLKRWREADRLGGGRNGENNLNSQASGKIYCWRFWLPIPLRILYIQTSTLKPITFWNKAP